LYVTTKHDLKKFGRGGELPARPWVAVLVTSSNLKKENTAISDYFSDFFAFLKGGGTNATSFLWKGFQLQKRLGTYGLDQGFPTFCLPCTHSAFQQMSMYPFNISTDEHVPLKSRMTKYFIMVHYRYI